jgi:MoxR-like ATPase
VVLVERQPGVGKTRLAQELTTEAMGAGQVDPRRLEVR